MMRMTGMRIMLKNRTSGQIEFGLIYGVIALTGLFAAYYVPVLDIAPGCVLKGITGLPCPSCGSTRSIVHLAHGNVIASVAMNPLMSLLLIGAVLFFLYSFGTLVLGMRRVHIKLLENEKKMVRTISVVVLLVNWLYLIMMLQ
jgi:hypothetical protein